MKRGNVEKTQGGFSVKPTVEYTEKQARESRMDIRKSESKSQPTNKDIYDLMMDMADRQREIYDLFKNR